MSLKQRIKGKEIRGLCSSVIYGANASGKTNIIGAMDTMRSIVLRGNIKNAEEQTSANPASIALELIPNNRFTKPYPVTFSANFIENSMQIQYRISIDSGIFLDEEYQRKVISEELMEMEVKFSLVTNY